MSCSDWLKVKAFSPVGYLAAHLERSPPSSCPADVVVETSQSLSPGLTAPLCLVLGQLRTSYKPEGCKADAALALNVPEASLCATGIQTAGLIGLGLRDGKIWAVLIVLYTKTRLVVLFFSIFLLEN